MFSVKKSIKNYSFICVRSVYNGEDKLKRVSALTLKMEAAYFFFSETMVNIYLFTEVTDSRLKGLIIAILQLTNTAPKPFAGFKPTSKQMERCVSKLQDGEVQHIQKDMKDIVNK